MSHDKIFTQFPAVEEGTYWMLDINRIECIGQSTARTGAVIYTPERTYMSVVDAQALNEGNFPDAAAYCYQILANAAIAASEEPMRVPGE